MATFPIQNNRNPLPGANNLDGFVSATSAKPLQPMFSTAARNIFPIADLANLGTVIANPIEVRPIFPLPSGSGGGASNPAGYAT